MATAAFDVNNQRILQRQRTAANFYLNSIGDKEIHSTLASMLKGPTQDVASMSARACFYAALACAVDTLNRNGAHGHEGLKALAVQVRPPSLTAASSIWNKSTGFPIGVWTHWLDGVLRHDGIDPGPIWKVTAPQHDPTVRLDWESLRKGPRSLPIRQADYLARAGLRTLSKTDAGWLLDQQTSTQPSDLTVFSRPPLVVRRLRRHQKEIASKKDRLTALDWVDWLNSLVARDPYDPRASEWTALEILRQLLKRIREFPGLEITVLDELHPANVLLPRAWLSEAPAPGIFVEARWTWETWKHVASSAKPGISLTRFPIQDFRRQPPTTIDDNDTHARWRARLRGCGLLLLGLVKRDFRLPAAWNVRGLERDTARFVKASLEEIPLSSHSHAIIEAALLPRSAETAVMRMDPWAFFGDQNVTSINDTTTDPPLILDVEGLSEAIVNAQRTLASGQISVLDHAPRQLIPMNVIQLVGAAVDLMDMDNDP